MVSSCDITMSTDGARDKNCTKLVINKRLLYTHQFNGEVLHGNKGAVVRSVPRSWLNGDIVMKKWKKFHEKPHQRWKRTGPSDSLKHTHHILHHPRNIPCISLEIMWNVRHDTSPTIQPYAPHLWKLFWVFSNGIFFTDNNSFGIQNHRRALFISNI